MALFSLREQPPPKLGLILEIAGGFLFIAVWWSVAIIWQLPKSILPTPLDVAKAFPVLFLGREQVWFPDNTLLQNIVSIKEALLTHVIHDVAYSIYLNVSSYLEAIAVAVPLGFAIGLFGPIRALTARWMAVIRYLPITAFTGVLMSWFGFGALAKIQFLTLGLIVYLVPTVVVRIDKVDQVFVDTAKTCGASRWQRITSVFWPIVSAQLSDDCKNLVPITWTYIVIAEGFNLGPGGLGALTSIYSRASRLDFVFAVIIIILTFGFFEDGVWGWGDRKLFPWKQELEGR